MPVDNFKQGATILDMDIKIEGRHRKTKIIGIRLFEEEYELISSIAKKKRLSRSFVAESFARAAIREWKRKKRTDVPETDPEDS